MSVIRVLFVTLWSLCGLSGPLVAANDVKPFHIHMVVWRGVEEAAKGYSDYLAERKIPHRLTIRDAAQNKANLPGFIEEINRTKPDLVVTWGTSVSLGLLGAYDDPPEGRISPDIPAIFMIVSQPVRARLVKSFTHSGRANVTGTRYLLPVAAQIKVARSYLPSRRNIGMIYNSLEDNAKISLTDLKALSENMDFSVTAMPIPLRDGKPDPSSLPDLVKRLHGKGVDLVYFGADSFLTKHLEAYTSEVVKHGLPIIAAGEHPVRRGAALLGVSSSYYDVGRYTAFRSLLILVSKVSPAEIPITPPSNPKLLINMSVAMKLGLPPPESLARIAELIQR